MKTSCWFAATVVMCLLALSPVVAEDPPSATDQSKAPVVAGEPQETRPVVQENSEQRPDGSAATKSERPGDPKQPEKVGAVGVKGSQQGEGAARKGTEVSKTGEEKKAKTPKRVFTEVPEDRRWIIKQHTLEGMKIPEEKPVPIKWENKAQQARCEPYIGQLKDKFLKARYYSIQGDPCVTAKYADEFMKLVEKCEGECPEGFLEKRGYDDRVVKNLNTLHKLGTESCLK